MSFSSRRRPGRPVGGQRLVEREQLLDAAERVIAREGSGASLEAIAEEAGVTKPIVYARVGSRTELSNALATRLADRMIGAAGTAVGPNAAFDRDVLAALFRSSLSTIATHRELFLWVTRGTTTDAPERTLFFAGKSAAPLAELFARWRMEWGDDRVATLPWAYAVVGMLNLVSLWWISEDGRPEQELADQLADLVWPGLATP